MDGAGAAAAPFAPMPSSGSSSSWKAQKNNVLRIVGLTLAVINTSANHPSKGLYPDSFDAFTAAQASNEDVYALFATFVAKEYVTGRGVATEKTFLSPDVAVDYLRTFVQIGKSLFGEASGNEVLLHVRRSARQQPEGGVAEGPDQERAPLYVSEGMSRGRRGAILPLSACRVAGH